MVQVLPAEQNFGSMLGQAIGSGLQRGGEAGLTNLMDQYFSQKKQQQESSALQKVLGDIPEGAPFDVKFKALMTAPVGIESKKLALENLVNFEKTQQARLENLQKSEKEEKEAALTHRAFKEAGFKMPEKHIPGTPASVYTSLASKQKEMEKEVNKDALREGMLRTLDLVKERGSAYPYAGVIPKAFSAKQREIRSEIDSLKGLFESALMPLVNKGTLAKERFKFILSLLPQSDDTEATIRGKLKGLRRTLKAEVPELEDIVPEYTAKKEKVNIQMKKRTSPEGKVHMINPETNESFFVPKNRIEEAKKDGFKVVQ